MVPIGHTFDDVPHRITKNTIKDRQLAFLRATVDDSRAYTGYHIVDNFGGYLDVSMVYLADGISADNLDALARTAATRYRELVTDEDDEYHIRLRRWGRDQRLYEWSKFWTSFKDGQIVYCSAISQEIRTINEVAVES